MITKPISKWVCSGIKDGKEFIEYIYAANWAQAEQKAKDKGLKLIGRFEYERD